MSVLSRQEVEPPPATAPVLAKQAIVLGLAFGTVRLQYALRHGRRDDLGTLVLAAATASALVYTGREQWCSWRARVETREYDLEAQAAVERGRQAIAEGDVADEPELHALRERLRARAS